MGVTIKDVAKLANVAPSTVSRVIANNPRISDKTKQKVREAMDELGYHPNFIARSLANQSTKVIGLVLPSSGDVFFQNPFFPTVLRGLSEGAHEKNFALQITTGQTDEEILDGVVQMVQGRRVDGVILLYSRVNDQIVSYLLERDFPFVVIGKPFKHEDRITHVDNDNFSATKEATQHLIRLGHERIAFIGGDLELVVTLERLLGYEKALESIGVEINNSYIVHEPFLEEGGVEAVKKLMNLVSPPTAMIVTDDLMALGVLKKYEHQYKVPRDISIVSFNNVLFGELSRPQLTSVDINIFELGYQASKALIDILETPNQEARRISVPHTIVVRQSCQSLGEYVGL
ncbi:LacI family transcriptional regulator [Bacillus coahuilensis m2-6]|uniref:LacI family DNA-binding transcriptional regulator n=1 Tax=Bacillus coahuilensis TaxID=408580 RepID=UPI000750376F|nr:LacI family DNA-binding transcriptional regulator [Bacillus coahuilensis]KUP09056.1 LacI family transcriptional regulator [Bacillus coahuilensis m2-6]